MHCSHELVAMADPHPSPQSSQLSFALAAVAPLHALEAELRPLASFLHPPCEDAELATFCLSTGVSSQCHVRPATAASSFIRYAVAADVWYFLVTSALPEKDSAQ